MRGGRVGSLAASPTLVGAVTVLVVVVAVFLAYQANQGLPFVPTYKLSAELPDADSLVPGNEVRIGGIRVGQIKSVDPVTVNDAPCPNDPTQQCRAQVAKLNMELNQDLQPLPENSTLVVRAKSALGLKYLEIDRGNSSKGFEPGATVPVTAARPEPVEIDQVFNMFDDPTRVAIQQNLLEFGNALAGRGVDLNEAIGQLKPLVQLLTPVMKNLADPNTGLSNFVSSLSATAAEVAPVAQIQGQLFVDLDTTFGAFARVARPFIQESISKGPAAEDTAIATLPTVRPFLANTTKLFAELRPGLHAIAPVQKDLGNSVVNGVKALALSPAFNAQLDPTAQSLLNLSNNAPARLGVQQLTQFNTTLGPPLSFITPAQSVCNYASILFSNAASLASYND
ncbi:MAG: MlaD family protein, partial [Solirubrobacterales bacterium]